MPSWRPDEWRTAVVLSGTFYYGLGDFAHPSKLKVPDPSTPHVNP